MPTISRFGQWTIYLLHFDQPVAGKRHYIGITRPNRLQARMIEHTTGRGSQRTRQACQQDTAWRLARTWRTEDPGLEKRLIPREEALKLCPVCRGLTAGRRYNPTQHALNPKSVESSDIPWRLSPQSTGASTDVANQVNEITRKRGRRSPTGPA